MARNNLSNKGPRKGRKKDSSGGDHWIVLALVGFTVAAIVVVVLFTIISTSESGSESNFTPNDQGLLKTGTQAPEFNVDTVDGGSVSSEKSSIGATMLVFFATGCPQCRREAPIISDFEDKYEDLRIAMIDVGAGEGDNPEKVRDFMEEYDIQSPAVYEPSLGAEYRVSSYPTVYVLNGNREIVAANSGGATPREVQEEWVQEALGV